MGRRDALYTLTDMFEMDECYLEVATEMKTKENLKSGKECQRKAIVAVSAESIPLADLETGKTHDFVATTRRRS